MSASSIRHSSVRALKRTLVVAETWGIKTMLAVVLLFALVVVWQTLEGCHEGIECIWTSAKSLAAKNEANTIWDEAYRVALTIIASWAAVEVYVTSLGLKIDSFLVNWFGKGHLVVVAGAVHGETNTGNPEERHRKSRSHASLAVEIARSEARLGERGVVLYLPGITKETRRSLWWDGVLVLQDELQATEILEATRSVFAWKLVAMRDEPDENVVLVHEAIAASRKQQASDSSGDKTTSKEDDVSYLLLIGKDDPSPSFAKHQLHRLRCFNEPELIARQLLTTYSPDEPVARSDHERVHVLIVGFGSVGEALLRRMGYLAHYRSGLRTKVTIVDESGESKVEKIRTEFPQLMNILQVEIRQVKPEGLDGDFLTKLQEITPLTAIYVCTKNEVFNLRASRALMAGIEKANDSLGRTALSSPKIVVLDPPGGCVLKGLKDDPDFKDRIALFSLVSPLSQETDSNHHTAMRSVLEDLDDEMARVLHTEYRTRPKVSNEAGLPWQDLEERFRASNRWAGDHFEVKLRAAGLELVPAIDDTPSNQVDERTLDLLGRMEHDRWVAEKVLAGLMLGAGGERDPRNKSDRDTLVPSAYLTSSEFDKDLNQVSKQIAYLTNEDRQDDRKVLKIIEGKVSVDAVWFSDEAISALADELLSNLMSALASESITPTHLLLHGSGRLAKCLILKLTGIDKALQVFPLHVTWVSTDAIQRCALIADSIDKSHLDLVPVQMPKDDFYKGIDVDPTKVLFSIPPVKAVVFCPDQLDRLPGVIDSLAAHLQSAKKAGLQTNVKVIGVAWSPTPTCVIRSGYLGDAEIQWIHAKEVLSSKGLLAQATTEES